MRLSLSPSAPVLVSSRDVRSLLRDTASILRIRYHEMEGSDTVADAGREFFGFMTDALSLFESEAPVLASAGAPPRRPPRRSWVINPLDGADAFRSGFPCFAVVLGFRERGRVVSGYVYNPVTEDLFWSDDTVSGAFHRDRAIGVRSSEGAPFGIKRASEAAGRCSSALSLCTVAAGRCDYASVDSCDWVTEAVCGYILRRAGGRVVTTRDGTTTAQARLRTRFRFTRGSRV